jgi:folate-binding protein YgfZ
MEGLRIADGIPAVPADIGPGELPNEGGLEAVAISYGKGCYLGQEVMARLKTMGQVRRRLLRVQGFGAIPPLPAAIHQGDRRVGELRTAVATVEGFIGLALLSLLHLRAEVGLSFSPGGDVALRVSEPS